MTEHHSVLPIQNLTIQFPCCWEIPYNEPKRQFLVEKIQNQLFTRKRCGKLKCDQCSFSTATTDWIMII